MDKIEIPRKEILRYLGYRGAKPDEIAEARIDACLKKAYEVSEPKCVRKSFGLRFTGEKTIDFTDDSGESVMTVESAGLRKNLDGCTEAELMAATVGMGIDRLIKRANLSSMADAAIYQAIGAAYVEEYCDRLNAEIIAETEERGMHARPRFSPGYGDFALDHQRDFARLLNMSKNAGIHLSETLLMTPSKSVTAVIGKSPECRSAEGSRCMSSACEECSARETCEYSRV